MSKDPNKPTAAELAVKIVQEIMDEHMVYLQKQGMTASTVVLPAAILAAASVRIYNKL